MCRRHHGPERGLDRSLWIGEEAGNARQRLVRLGIKDMKDGADEQSMAGFLPMVATFERPFRVHQHIGDVLDIAHLPFSATNLKQRVVRCRLRVCRVEQQHAAVPRTKARRQTPILALDVMDNATAWPGQQGRHHKADTLARSGRCKAQHMFWSVMPEVVALELAEHDTVWRGETSGTNLNWRRPASRAVGGGDFRFARAPYRHANPHRDRDQPTTPRDV